LGVLLVLGTAERPRAHLCSAGAARLYALGSHPGLDVPFAHSFLLAVVLLVV